MRDSEDPSIIYIFEVFRDRESHATHAKTAHFAEWVDKAVHLLDGDMEIVVMDTAFPTPKGYESQKGSLIDW